MWMMPIDPLLLDKLFLLLNPIMREVDVHGVVVQTQQIEATAAEVVDIPDQCDVEQIIDQISRTTEKYHFHDIEIHLNHPHLDL